MNPFPTAYAPPAEEINITLDGLDESLASSNWQIRKASYQFLQEKIQAVLSGREPLNQLSGDDVYSSLDEAVRAQAKLTGILTLHQGAGTKIDNNGYRMKL